MSVYEYMVSKTRDFFGEILWQKIFGFKIFKILIFTSLGLDNDRNLTSKI